MMNSNLGLMVGTYLVLLVLQVGFFGVMYKRFSLYDQGWALTRLGFFLVLSLIMWFVGHVGLVINNQGVVWGLSLVLFIIGVTLLLRRRELIVGSLYKIWPVIVVEEFLFLFGFFFLTTVKGFNPDILDLEKFMDAGFINMYLQSPTLPASDMWLSGMTVNYYTFGHFLGMVILRFLGIDLAYGYNLILGIYMGMVMTLSFSFCINLIRKMDKRLPILIPGFISSVLVVFGGNMHTLWYFLKNKSFLSYWYADATRFIPNTIHEFPAYSFVVSDLHGHVFDLPVVLLFLTTVLVFFSEKLKIKRRVVSLILGLLLSVMGMINIFDLLIYGVFLLGVFYWQLFRGVRLSQVITEGALVIVGFGLGFSPFFFNFDSFGQGIGLVSERSPLWQLLVLWGGHLLLSALALFTNEKKKGVKGFLILLYVFSLILITIPELIYVKDIYPSHPRANTMFKLGYQAFLMMCILVGVGVAIVAGLNGIFKKIVLKVTILGFLLASLSYSYFAYRDYYGGFRNYRGLDGMSWLMSKYPYDYEGIKWLRNNFRRDKNNDNVILEAVGESYTDYGRVSVFSGLPTVLGWRVHEWLWRGSFDIPALRTGEVQIVYENPRSLEAKEVLRKYDVRFIFLGEKEFEAYRVVQGGLVELGEVVFSMGDTKIIEVDKM